MSRDDTIGRREVGQRCHAIECFGKSIALSIRISGRPSEQRPQFFAQSSRRVVGQFGHLDTSRISQFSISSIDRSRRNIDCLSFSFTPFKNLHGRHDADRDLI